MASVWKKRRNDPTPLYLLFEAMMKRYANRKTFFSSVFFLVCLKNTKKLLQTCYFKVKRDRVSCCGLCGNKTIITGTFLELFFVPASCLRCSASEKKASQSETVYSNCLVHFSLWTISSRPKCELQKKNRILKLFWASFDVYHKKVPPKKIFTNFSIWII